MYVCKKMNFHSFIELAIQVKFKSSQREREREREREEGTYGDVEIRAWGQGVVGGREGGIVGHA